MPNRKPSAPKYTPERASAILAEAEFWGDEQICKKWQITRRTLRNYRVRLRVDDELSQLFLVKKRLLMIDWQEDATQALKIALSELSRRIPIAASEEDAKLIHAIAGACKIVGELKIQYEALVDDGDQQQA
jgi:hypothetical protein